MLRRLAILAILYIGVTAVMTAPYLNLHDFATASYPGDTRLIIWTLAWDNHAVLDRVPLFGSNIFYPAPSSLAYNEHLFGLSLFTLPLYAATRNPVLAYNVVWVLSFLLNLLAAHALLKRLTGQDAAAFAGALIYTFSFYKMLHAHGHLQHIWTWLIPLSLICLERWRERPSFWRALVWGLTVVLQSLTSWYLAVMIIIVQAAALLALLPQLRKDRMLTRVWQLALVTVFAAAVLIPFAVPYRALPPSPAQEAVSNSADLAGYLIPPENTWTGRLWLAGIGRGPRWIWGERTIFIGWIALALAAAGVYELTRLRRRRVLCLFGGIAAIAFLLSLGPSVSAGGGSLSLFSMLTAVPGLEAFRAPARFAVLVLLAVSVAAAFGTSWLLRTLRPGGPYLAVLLPLMLSEWYVVKFPGGRPRPEPIPPVYRSEVLASARALVSLPDYRGAPDWYTGADYLYYSTAHWRPIVNGFGRTEPLGHARAISHMKAFPGPNNARTMRQLGVEYVIVHADRLSDGGGPMIEEALASPEYRLVVRIGSDYLFAVLPEAAP